jgi:aspartate/methionine/tyrosine aminotransferase
MFSSRLPSTLLPNAVARELSQRRESGGGWLDLTESNPTRVGLLYPPALLTALAEPHGLVYEPAPFGLPAARQAVAADYARKRTPVDPGRIVLTASTSEAYALLFKLLCDASDEVLVPQPSYPLFEHLTMLELVRPRGYRLQWDGVWSIDRSSVEAAFTSRTRAVLVVSPNNPTGSMLRGDDRTWLAALCAERGAALIADEVFIDYPLNRAPDAVPALGHAAGPLTFSLGGLSKSAGLPQLKLAWIAMDGPSDLADAATERLEVICDTYLSVSTPVQHAASRLIASGAHVRAAILARVETNLRRLTTMIGNASPVSLLPPEGGWSAVLRVPAIESEESLVLRMLREADVLVHPGYFFDFESEAFLVVSLLPAPETFVTAMERVLDVVQKERV